MAEGAKGQGGTASARHDRPLLMAFVNDSADESALRHGLGDGSDEGFEIRRGGIKAAIAAMQKMATPRILVVDVAGEDQPLAALGSLSEVVEPDVQVLVVGDLRDGDFYREITRGLGAIEYLHKPLNRDRVARYFGPIVHGRAPAAEAVQGGRFITVTGVRGGVGATTIACNLAWHFGEVSRRHTVLLDANLQNGTTSLLLNTAPSPGLRTALETPERVDELFVERAAQPIGDRLHVLAGLESLADHVAFAPDAARGLLGIMRKRYTFVVADVPFAPVSVYRDLLDLSHQRVLVMEPTLASVRDAARLLALPSPAEHASRTVVVLNRLGMRGGMTRRQIEDALEIKADLVIPDQPAQMHSAANLGEPAAAARGFFKVGIGELARQVASNRLYDSEAQAAVPEREPAPRWSLSTLLGRR